MIRKMGLLVLLVLITLTVPFTANAASVNACYDTEKFTLTVTTELLDTFANITIDGSETHRYVSYNSPTLTLFNIGLNSDTHIVSIYNDFTGLLASCIVSAKDMPDTPCGMIGDNLAWQLTDDGTLYLSGTGNLAGDYSISPWGNIPERVMILQGITSIGNNTFLYSTNLTSITIPDSVTSIDDTFSTCTSLTNIDVNSGNTYYTSVDGVLFNKNISTLITCPNGKIGAYTIPDSVTSIGERAFSDCTGLTSISIPDSVTSIGERAFSHCTSLTSINVSASNTSYASQDGMLFNKDKSTLITCPAGYVGEYSIPYGVTSIGERAFSDCTGLTSISIPDSVTSIGECAFSSCTSLTSITIPNSVTSIGEYAFEYCAGLTSVTIPDTVTSIGDFAFGWCSSLTSITISDSVISIGQTAFYGCSDNLTIYGSPGSYAETFAGERNIPFKNILILSCAHEYSAILVKAPTEEEQGSAVFVCPLCGHEQPIDIPALKDMKSLRMPAGLTIIEAEAFAGLNVEAVIIPDGCTSIGSRAFADCPNLVYVRIPASVTSIAEDAFEGCEQVVIDRIAE